jgi:hypothetical protein
MRGIGLCLWPAIILSGVHVTNSFQNSPGNQNSWTAFDVEFPEWLGAENVLQWLAPFPPLAELEKLSVPLRMAQ